MLSEDVERYLALRQSLGFKLDLPSRRLRAFARFAAASGDTHVRAATAVAWAATAPSRGQRHRWLGIVAQLARFLQAEDPAHEVPPANLFATPKTRPSPYIYTQEELIRIVDAAGRLRPNKLNPLRQQTYATLFGLIAATGLRVSEALNLKIDDLLPGGILRIRETKFCKSRLVPLHETVVSALGRYLEMRSRVAGADDHIFLSAGGRRLSRSAASDAFWQVLQLADIAPGRARRPRIHDLRHSFATRVLEQCATRRDAVARHFVALATYLGHAHAGSTYWYLQATPQLLTDIASATEALARGEVA
jgi:integrase/recombinase XerD